MTKIKVCYESFGLIEKEKGDNVSLLATGFVCFKSNYVITCLHVVKNQESLFYHPANNANKFLLTKIREFPLLDLVIFELPKGILWPAFQLENEMNCVIGDKITYIGYDKIETVKDDYPTISVKTSTISSINGNYFYFTGYCRGGFSGSPILNENGRVIGIIQGGKIISITENIMDVQNPFINTSLFNGL